MVQGSVGSVGGVGVVVEADVVGVVVLWLHGLVLVLHWSSSGQSPKHPVIDWFWIVLLMEI